MPLVSTHTYTYTHAQTHLFAPIQYLSISVLCILLSPPDSLVSFSKMPMSNVMIVTSLAEVARPSVRAMSRARAEVSAEMQRTTRGSAAETEKSVSTQLQQWEAFHAWQTEMDSVARECGYLTQPANDASCDPKENDHGDMQAVRALKRSRAEMENETPTSAEASSSGIHTEFEVGHWIDVVLHNAHSSVEEEAQSILSWHYQRVQQELLRSTNLVNALEALRQLDAEDFRQRQRDLESKLRVSRGKVTKLRRALAPPRDSLRLTLED